MGGEGFGRGWLYWSSSLRVSRFRYCGLHNRELAGLVWLQNSERIHPREDGRVAPPTRGNSFEVDVNAETLRFLALRGWLRLVVGSCPWCATRQAIAMIEAEGGRRHSDGKGMCDGGGLCDDKMKLFLPSKPRPGETATESTSVECRCRARAYSVQVGKRSVVICWKCTQEKASSV